MGRAKGLGYQYETGGVVWGVAWGCLLVEVAQYIPQGGRTSYQCDIGEDLGSTHCDWLPVHPILNIYSLCQRSTRAW